VFFGCAFVVGRLVVIYELFVSRSHGSGGYIRGCFAADPGLSLVQIERVRAGSIRTNI
jgi:hypothetical protein